jgi:hypothetical protein
MILCIYKSFNFIKKVKNNIKNTNKNFIICVYTEHIK